MKSLHSQIIIEPNFIPNEVCDYIVNYVKTQQLKDLEVFDSEKTNQTKETQWKLDKKIRDTQTVETKPILPLLETIIRKSVFDIVNPFYNIKIESSESPQILRYGVGGHYNEHIDGEAKYNNGGTIEWRKTVDRDVSFLFYINDEYEGGELIMPDQNIKIKPQKGMFLAFPSSHHFLHGVVPVTAGERFAFVTWAKL